jgi:hypothetical protein
MVARLSDASANEPEAFTALDRNAGFVRLHLFDGDGHFRISVTNTAQQLMYDVLAGCQKLPADGLPDIQFTHIELTPIHNL